jgi:hypothetical protein
MVYSYGEPMLQGILFSNPKAYLDMQDLSDLPLYSLAITPLHPAHGGLQATFHLA